MRVRYTYPTLAEEEIQGRTDTEMTEHASHRIPLIDHPAIPLFDFHIGTAEKGRYNRILMNMKDSQKPNMRAFNATDRTPAPTRSRHIHPRILGMAIAILLVYTCVPAVPVSATKDPDTLTELSVVEETLEATDTPPSHARLAPAVPSAEEEHPTVAHISPASEDEQITMPALQSPPTARAATTVRYPYPSGAMAVTLYKDGKTVLQGHVADIGGVVYVPVQRFADLFGSFRTTYNEATEQVVITGTNLSITVRVGDPYITVNERIFYTGVRVLSLGGWIFVPMTAMCKALGAEVTIRAGYYDAFITSGDPTKLPWASEYYDSTDLYWLSRIISAEAKGESLEGQIAVGNVVLNRKRSSQFPNTVKGVIFDTKYGVQFSPAANGTIYQAPTTSSVRAAKICLEGYSLSSRVLYFFNPKIATSTWISRTRPYIMTIGNHKFYG